MFDEISELQTEKFQPFMHAKAAGGATTKEKMTAPTQSEGRMGRVGQLQWGSPKGIIKV